MCIRDRYGRTHEFYSKTETSRDNWVAKLRRVSISLNITADFTFDRLLGKGNFAKVHLAHRRDNKVFAVKSIEKAKILEHPRNTRSMHCEIDVMRRLNHEGIIALHEVYENARYVHLVLEYLEGGELLQRLQNRGTYSEKDASLTIRRILQALDYCHKKSIIHRDLKPENLILSYFCMVQLETTPTTLMCKSPISV
eukprot:TRINITY_DN9548_c0_g1_i5.p2 TRINITY_DN9548_c0_g1~~TRINITY_DN9548_c0_g1_i5.p2  ORF type:complete len:196 (+),score=53.15 TRINITY_DN9548_c0_g1_i5:69-656(+)